MVIISWPGRCQSNFVQGVAKAHRHRRRHRHYQALVFKHVDTMWLPTYVRQGGIAEANCFRLVIDVVCSCLKQGIHKTSPLPKSKGQGCCQSRSVEGCCQREMVKGASRQSQFRIRSQSQSNMVKCVAQAKLSRPVRRCKSQIYAESPMVEDHIYK